MPTLIDDFYSDTSSEEVQKHTNINTPTLVNDSDSDTSEDVHKPMTAKKAIPSLHAIPVSPPLAPCTITSLFEYQFSIHPQSPAVEFENQKPITYSQLKTLADRVTQCLPFRKGLIVPICLDPSPELVASVLGVLFAGAAYAILDPNGSIERNRSIIAETKAPVILTSDKYSGLYDGSLVVKSILERTVPRRRDSRAGDTPHFNIASPAYLVYTSGTSGKPKGVVISHAAATYGMSYFSMNGRSRLLLVFNPIFSAAQRAILATLCKGACLCLTSKDRLAFSLQDVVENMQIDTLSVTPSLLSTLSPKAPLPTLKQITTVGEPVSAAILDSWVNKVEFRVSYGLSECGQLNFSRHLRQGDNPMVIGRPSDTTEAYILRLDSMELADFGEPGELCLAGPQLSDGYFNRPNETAKAFVPNPFGPGRMFHTGDLAVQDEDGNIQVLGRIDFQIKINAQRVEPEEVSAVLCKHVAVRQATVILANVSENKSLVAAIIISPEIDWNRTIRELRLLAQEFLPAYMVPSYWLRYDTLPTNANGKIDIRQLQYRAQNTPAHEMIGHDGGLDKPVDPITDPVEKVIQSAWADVLGLKSYVIGRHDAFLALGGNSMQAIRMVNQLRGKGIDLGLDALFNHADIETLRATAIVSEVRVAPVIAEIAPFSLIKDKDLATSLRTPEGIVDAYPATPLQESLIGLTLQGSTDYLYQRVWDVRNLDLRSLKLAFHIAFLKGDILRTTFDWTDSGLMQIIRKDFHFPWQELESPLEEYKKNDKEASITLGQPLFHVALLNNTTLVVSMHHSLFDFWSSTFIYEDVASLYDGFEPQTRPPFKNFMKTLLDSDSNEPQQFWESYLSGASQTLLGNTTSELPTSASRTAPNRLNQISAALNVTPGTLLSFAWALILSHHLDSKDVTFASTLSGREIFLDQIDQLDGPTLTVVPRRFQLEPSVTLQEAVLAAHKDSFQVLKYSQYGMRNALKAAGQTSTLFDTMVNILPGIGKSGTRSPNQVFKRLGDKPIWNTEYTTLQIEIDRDIIHFSLISGFEDKRAGFILDQIIGIIEQLSQNSQLRIESLSIITPAEVQMMSAPKYFPSSSAYILHGGYEDTVRTKPWRTAFQWQNEEVLTYRMLNQRANKLARYLQQKGLKRGDFVCLLLEKSPTMIVSILAVLKTGAAYVPMSPENPFDRNAFIIQEAGAKALITQKFVPRYGEYKDVDIILPEDLDLSKISHTPLNVSISGDDVAYVIFTSGSTGTPKGCVINHAAAASAIESMIRAEGRRNEEVRALQFSNYTFDASVLDIFNTLNSGGTLCMAPNDRLLSDLPGVIDEMNITHSFFTPTVARLFSKTDCPSLRRITMGGESLTDDVFEIMSNRKVIQFYGPTETAMVVTSREMSVGDNPKNLGKPFDTVHAFILERDDTDLVPYGAIGELVIAGPQVGLGYLNRADLTAAAFTQIPICGAQKVYRTGDLARWLPNGEIECLGRKDNQVKINGYRIELGEIENAILATSVASQCVVLVAQINNKAQLAAFIVFKDSTSSEERFLSTDEVLENVLQLRTELSGLASYMYPKVLLPLSKMPTMPSGKSNRKLLGSWFKEMGTGTLSNYCFEEFGSSLSIIPCTTPTQQLLEKAFTKLLSIPSSRLGQNANFLSLGGDSISAINLSSLMRKENQILSVSHILKYPKLADMASHLSFNQESSLPTREFEVPDITPQLQDSGLAEEEIEYIYPCPAGQSEFLIQGNRPEQMWALMTIRELNSPPEKWISAVEKLTEMDDILRTTFTSINGQWIGVVLKSPSPTITCIPITNPSDRETAISHIWSSRFKFGKSFINYTILNHSTGKVELVIKLDHALYDGTLLRLFASQFHSIQHSLPPPPYTPFHEFAKHLYQTPKPTSLAFWSLPENTPTGFQFPALPPTTPIMKPIATKPLFYPIRPQNLNTLSTNTSTTIPTLFQAAFTLYLSLSSLSQTPEYDYLYTGRNISLPIPDSINGTCANFLPLKAFVSYDMTVKDFLVGVQDRFWEVTEKGGAVGLEDIYSHVGLDRETQGNRALFLFQPFDPAPIGKPKISPVSTSAAERIEGEEEKEEVEEEMRYLYMAGCEVKMNQPYVLVCEIHKMIEGYKIKFTIDGRIFGVEEAKKGMRVVEEIMERMVSDVEGKQSLREVMGL